MSISLTSDSIWEAVRSYLDTQLRASLSLKTCEQGNYINLPTRDDLSDVLPLIAIEVTESNGQALPGFRAIELDHLLRIHYMVLLADTDVATRKVTQTLETIANLFAQTPWEGSTALPGYTPGANVNVFEKSAPSLRVLDTFTELELPIGHGTVELRVKVHYFDA